jgi:hypothetical protein
MNRHTSWQRFVAVVGVALLVAVVGNMSPAVLADPEGFVFTPLAFLGDPAPRGDTFLAVFESNRINNRGDVLFGTEVPREVPTQEEFGLFLLRKGEITQIARAGEPAPGGSEFDSGFLSPTTLNDQGDAGFVFLLDPFSFPPEGPPFGVNAGVYRFSQSTHTVTPVVIPEVTEVPGGGVFKGAHFGASLNNRGDLVFPGIVETDKGIHLPDEPYIGLGVGLFKANKKGHISRVVNPGDAVPGGGVFDGAFAPWMNDGGDVVFMGHVAEEECRAEGSPPQEIVIGCLGSVYVKDAATGNIRSIAHAGDPAPGGGVYREAKSPVINNRGDIVFLGDLTSPPAAALKTGVFLRSGGETIAVARPGDPMPGGGAFVTASPIIGWQIHVNNPGDVVFNATLDTSTLSTDNGEPIPDTGLYVWLHGSLRLVARTGTVIRGVGTIAHLVMNVLVVSDPESPAVFVPNSGAHNNDRGQVVFGATLCDVGSSPCATSDGRGVLLVATPKSHTRDD